MFYYLVAFGFTYPCIDNLKEKRKYEIPDKNKDSREKHSSNYQWNKLEVKSEFAFPS